MIFFLLIQPLEFLIQLMTRFEGIETNISKFYTSIFRIQLMTRFEGIETSILQICFNLLKYIQLMTRFEGIETFYLIYLI